MLTNIFENRDTKLKTIFSIGDSLARSLRKGVELFSIDGNKVTYVTEDKKLVSGDLDGDGLVDVQISDSSVFENADSFSDFLSSKVESLVESLRTDSYTEASQSFSDVLKTWELSTKYERVTAKLADKVQNLTANNKILESEQFAKIKDLREPLVNWLKENKDALLESEQIINSILLANKISSAFAFKKLTYDEISEAGEYRIVNENYLPIYQIICQQELIKKELLEAKESMESIWVEDKDFDQLAKLILESDPAKIEKALATVISNIPYFAFASKNQISNILQSKLSLTENSHAIKDVKAFASKLFEMKKPIREELTNLLSKKYGISLNNLKEVPSFKTLIGTQITVFESLARLSKRSAYKSVLKEFAEFLKDRNGVEILDINEFVNEMFKDAGITLNENSLMQYLDFNRVADDVMKIGAVLKMIQGATQNPQMGATPGIPLGTIPGPSTSPQIAPPAPQPMAAPSPMPGAGPMPGGTPNADPMTGNAQMPQDQYPGNESDPAMMAAQGAKQDMEGELNAQGALPQEPTPMAQNQLAGAMAQLDALLQDLSMQIGRASGGGMGEMPMGGETGHMEPDGDEGIPMDGEGEEGIEGEEEGQFGDEEGSGEEGEEDIEYVDMTGDEEGDAAPEEESDEEESAPPPKKEKKPSSKPLNKSKPKK